MISEPTAELSTREREVAWLGAEFSTEEIGERLGISPRTAKSYLDAARRKLGVKRKRDLPKVLRERGINPPTEEE